jgi:DHA2 family multidrug resistance protein-like MFS transporter
LIFNMFRDQRQRSAAIGIWITSFSVGGAIGPVFGGVLLEYFWWGSVFLLALPVMALLLVLGPRLLPEYRDPQAGRLDLRSAGMSLAAVLAVIYGLKQIVQDGFSAQPAAAILAGLLIGFLFVRRQLRLADPLIDLRLFRIPTFSVSLATNVLAVFVAVGYFLFVAQYLQLVLGLSPLQAGLWSLPSAVGFIVGSNLAPRFVHRVRPGIVLGGTLTLAALALGVLTQVTGTTGLALVVLASVVISLALSPVFTLTTELIVGSAPPEKAGSASGISETGSELGGALGLAILGSIGTAQYRSAVASALPAGISVEAAEAALDTLGGAVVVAGQLPGPLGLALLDIAREAFVQGLHLAAAISAVVAIGAAVMAVVLLRREPAGAAPQEQETVGPEPAVQASAVSPRPDVPGATPTRQERALPGNRPDGGERAVVEGFVARVNALDLLPPPSPALQAHLLEEVKTVARTVDGSRETGAASGYDRRVLHEDPAGWSLALIILQPGQHTHPHNHGGWGCAVTIQGVERDRRFIPDGSGSLVLTGERDYPPGTGYTFDPADVHQPVGADPQRVTVALHFLVSENHAEASR